jgi:hypothetical protein
VKYRFRAAKSFRRALAKLAPEEKRLAAASFKIFKQNPFDPRLRPHKIHKLSAIYGKTIHAIEIAGDLRAAFYIEGNVVWSVDIETIRFIEAKAAASLRKFQPAKALGNHQASRSCRTAAIA